MINLSELSKYKEGNRLEAKKAAGGLPKSLWETYSAFANTNGGVILLGVEEFPDKSFSVTGLSDPEKLVRDFWNTFNNREKISQSILLEKHVRIEKVGGDSVIVIEVPRADRGLKPVFINQNLYAGTFRRNSEGDYHCSPEAVRAMIRDNGEKTQDMLVLSSMLLDVFDYQSLRHYRNRMKVTRPGHVWETLEDVEFLQKLGAIGVGEDEKLHPTAAVILKMFNLLNVGERTGSGIPLIFTAWEGNGFNNPAHTEKIEINRSFLSLPLTKTSDKKQAIKASNKKQAIKTSDNEHVVKTSDNEHVVKTSNKKRGTTVSIKAKIKKSDERKRDILDYLTSHAASTSKEVAEHLGIGSDRARVYLLGLSSAGVVIAEGENRNRTYRLKPKG